MEIPIIHITDYDMERLRSFLRKAQNWPTEGIELINKLKTKLDSANITPQKQVPPYLVTMNYYIRVTNFSERKDIDFWLTYPEERMVSKDKTSIASDVGIAVLGSKVVYKFEVINNKVTRWFRVAKILYQPEANKHYKL